MTATRCTCGFTELADEELMDHLLWVLEPDDQMGNDGLVHEERERLACACGVAAVTAEELDAHFITVFTAADATSRDGQRHEPLEHDHGA